MISLTSDTGSSVVVAAGIMRTDRDRRQACALREPRSLPPVLWTPLDHDRFKLYFAQLRRLGCSITWDRLRAKSAGPRPAVMW